MTEFVKVKRYPRMLEHTVGDFCANVEFSHMDSDFNFYGNITVTKLGGERNIMGHTIRDRLDRYRTTGPVLMTVGNPQRVVMRVNTKLAYEYGVVVAPIDDLYQLLDPIIKDLLRIKEEVLNPPVRSENLKLA